MPLQKTLLERLMRFCVRAERSGYECALRLKVWGELDAVPYLEKLVEKGFLDPDRFAHSRARHRASMGYGPRWVRQELRMHGIEPASIQLALETVDWHAAFLTRARKSGAQKNIVFRYGFEESHQC